LGIIKFILDYLSLHIITIINTRQGCPAIYDICGTSGGSVVGREKVWSLAFPNYLVIVGKSEREMKEMMKSLGKHVRKKKLEVNVDKTKMMMFNKRKRKSEENEWYWEGRKIEQANEFKYLGYTLEPRISHISER
jgi:hypothetical protein